MRDEIHGTLSDGEGASGCETAGPFSIDAQRISHERLEDEVIIIHLEKGAYFSGSGSSADLWSLLTQGASADQAIQRLSQHYAVDPEVVRPSIEHCIGALVKADILRPAEAGTPLSEGFVFPSDSRTEWTAPAFDEYTDMWDLIQLDPIHDVDDAGWPYALPQATL